MNKNLVIIIVIATLISGVIGGYIGSLVGNQSDGQGAGTRFPSGLSVDGTSPTAGQVRSTTLTVSGASTLTGAATLSSTLAVTGIVTFSDELNTQEASESVTGDDTLTVAQSNLTSYIEGAIASSTLPSVAGATSTVYRWVVAASVTGDKHIVSAEGDNIEGSLMVAGAIVDCDAVDRISFIADGENLGDFVELRSDGQKWFITASNALTSAKLTCTEGI